MDKALIRNAVKFNIPHIPEVRKLVNASEYEVFGMIFDFYSKGKDCFFSNKYIAEVVNKTTSSVEKILATLEKKNLIRRKKNPRGAIARIIFPNMDYILKLIENRIAAPDRKKFGWKPQNTEKVEPQKNESLTNKNNIYIENRDKYKKLSNDENLKKDIKEFFEKETKDIEAPVDEMTEKFMNKYLKGGERKRNIKNWRGLAANFQLNWRKFAPAEQLRKRAQIDPEIERIKMKIIRARRAKFRFMGREFAVDGTTFFRDLRTNEMAPIREILKIAKEKKENIEICPYNRRNGL